MNYNLTSQQKKQLQDLGVLAVYLFGSVAEGYDAPHSDVDIGVVFKQPLQADSLDLYNQLYDIFTAVFPGKEVDIVLADRATLELKADMIAQGILLFESSSEARMDFESKITLLYADFKPVLQFFNSSILSRI